MIKYKNLSGNSGITHYRTAEDQIHVKFKGRDAIYVYSDKVTGKSHVKKMKTLAEKGVGLGTYISQHPKVKNGFTTIE